MSNRFLAAAGHDVIATTRQRDRVNSATTFLDMGEGLGALPRADVAVICAAITRFSDCRNFPELARQVNVTAPVANMQGIGVKRHASNFTIDERSF